MANVDVSRGTIAADRPSAAPPAGQPTPATPQQQTAVTAAAAPAPGDKYLPTGSAPTGLKHHVLFFDENGDHHVTLAESRHGLEKLGLGRISSTLLPFALNPILGKQASGHYTTNVAVDGLFRNFKPTTTGIFGPGGAFVPERFESLFAKNDRNHDGALDSSEIDTMLKHDLIVPSERSRTKVGFELLLKVAGDRQVVTDKGQKLRAISKDQLKAFYDGDLFYDIARKHGH